MAMVNGQGMSDMAFAFAIHYAAGLQASEAAIKAGYSKKVAKQTAQKLLNNPKVKAFISRELERMQRGATLQKKEVLAKLGQSLRRNLWDFEGPNGFIVSSLKEIPREDHCFIDGFKARQFFDEDGKITSQTIEVKLSPNAAIQDMAMKHVGAYAPVETRGEQKVVLDWNSLNGKPDEKEEDIIEGQIQELLTEEPNKERDDDESGSE